jgi:phosphoglycerate kinase
MAASNVTLASKTGVLNIQSSDRSRVSSSSSASVQCQASGLRLSLKASPLRSSNSQNAKKKQFALRIVAEAQKTETLSPTSLLGEEGKSDIDSHASKASDRKLSIGDVPKEEFKGKVVFVRADLNVPLDDKQNIGDDTRIRASIPTIEYLLAAGAKVVLASHLGRPKKGPEAKFSLKPVGARLGEYLKRTVPVAPDCIGPEVEKLIDGLKNGDILLLENVRFHKEEEKNDVEFSKKLAKKIDIFVNDAFGSAHRAHSSTAGIASYVSKRFAGFLLQKELDYLAGAISKPARPFVAIVGGSKVSSKIAVIESLLNKSDKVILGGGMVFTFFKSQGLSVGSSIVENDKLDLAIHLTELAKEKGVELILPVDVLAADKFAPDANVQVVDYDKIPEGWTGLDIGPRAIEQFKKALKGAKTVLWNGPMGVFEFEAFSKGTFAIANALADLTAEGAITIIGGGDSVAAIEKAGLADKVSHVSTGGGASLELLEGKTLPGVAVLDEPEIVA